MHHQEMRRVYPAFWKENEIRAYNGKLNYRELVELVTRINNRVNAQVNQGTGRIPLMYFNREKAFLNSLPADPIRKPYPYFIEYLHRSLNFCLCLRTPHNTRLNFKTINIHVYCNTEFITIHQLSSKKLNYISEHYAAIARKSHIFKEEQRKPRLESSLISCSFTLG